MTNTNNKTVLFTLAGALLVLGIGFVLFASFKPSGPDPAASGSGVKKKNPLGLVTDEERPEYIRQFVEVKGLEVGADAQINHKGETVATPGLVKITGEVTNKGERPIADLVVVVFPLDASKKVLGAFQESVKGGKPVAPGETLKVGFRVRDKKDWDGAFEHKVK